MVSCPHLSLDRTPWTKRCIVSEDLHAQLLACLFPPCSLLHILLWFLWLINLWNYFAVSSVWVLFSAACDEYLKALKEKKQQQKKMRRWSSLEQNNVIVYWWTFQSLIHCTVFLKFLLFSTDLMAALHSTPHLLKYVLSISPLEHHSFIRIKPATWYLI